MRSHFLNFFRAHWPTGRVSALSLAPALVLPVLSLVNCSGHKVLGEEIADSCDLRLPHSGKTKVNAATFWMNYPEAIAMEVLEDRSQQLGLTLSSTRRQSRRDLQLSLIEWLELADDPLPDVYQVNSGSDVLQFALNAPSPDTQICDLNSLDKRYDFRGRYFRAAWEPAQCQGSLYSVPLNVHRINTMLVNLDVYAEYLRLPEASEFDFPEDAQFESSEALVEFLEWAGAQHMETAAGTEVIPFSLGIGADSVWTLSVVAFENLLASYGDGLYESVWRGGKYATSQQEMQAGISRLANHLRRLGTVSNLGDALSWQDATALVANGMALLTISGDWTRAIVDDARRAQVTTLVFPGTVGSYIYTPDSFSVPRRSGTDGSTAHAWFRDVIDDRETQFRFAIEKQAIPALADVSADELDKFNSEYLKNSYLEFKACQEPDSECKLLLAVSGLGPAGAHDPCFDQLGLLLGTIAGTEYASEEWDDHDCPTPIPKSSVEAEEALSGLLLEVSAAPYATQCRPENTLVE